MRSGNSYFNSDDINKKIYDHRLMMRIIPFLKPYSKTFLLAIFLTFFSTLCQLTVPWVVGRIVDTALKPKNLENLYYLAFIYGSLRAAAFFAYFGESYFLQLSGQKVLNDLRNKIFRHMQSLPMTFFDKNPTGRLLTRVTNDVVTLAELFSAALVNVLGDLMQIVGITLVMLGLSLKLGAATLSIMPLLFITAWFLTVKMRITYRDVRAKLAQLNTSIVESISGMGVIQVFRRQFERAGKFNKMNESHREAELKSVFYNSFFRPVSKVINALTTFIIIGYGAYLSQQGQVSIGLLVAFIGYIQHLFEPIQNLSEKVSVFQSAMASAERIFILLEETPEVDDDSATDFIGINKSIEFKNLNFSYSKDKPVLKDLSFRIEKGERVAIVGHTGAGKTTIASILKRFYEISDGDVLLDNKPLKSFSKSSLRRKIALIQQDVFIFSGSIIDNILPGQSEKNHEKALGIIKELEMENFVKNLPEGLDTEIMERGSNLSSGQKQLIAFSRAMAFEPEILILDEATSSVDTETEQVVQKAISRLTSNKTSIIIAHRLSTIKNCDKIIVLHHGRMIEQGTHAELLNKRGHYYTLNKIQFSE